MSKKNYRYSVGVALADTVRLYEGDENGKGTQISCRLRIIEGPQTGREVNWYGSLTGGAVEYTLKALRSMGWRCADITVLEGLGSAKVTIAEYEDNYNGKRSTKVDLFPYRAPKATVSDDKKAAFAAKFKAMAAGMAAIEVTDDLKAPEVLPEATNAPAPELAAAADADPWR